MADHHTQNYWKQENNWHNQRTWSLQIHKLDKGGGGSTRNGENFPAVEK